MDYQDKWASADREVPSLANRLRQNDELKALVVRSLPHVEARSDEWWETLCGMLAGFPRMLVRDDPNDVRKRLSAFEDAIVVFAEKAAEFERATELRLPSANDAVGINLRDSPNGGVSLFEFLEVIREYVQREGAPWCHHLIRTPTGQAPRNPSSAAAWLSIRVLEALGAKHGPRFHEAAAACASAVCGEYVDQETVKAMLWQRDRALSERAEG